MVAWSGGNHIDVSLSMVGVDGSGQAAASSCFEEVISEIKSEIKQAVSSMTAMCCLLTTPFMQHHAQYHTQPDGTTAKVRRI